MVNSLLKKKSSSNKADPYSEREIEARRVASGPLGSSIILNSRTLRLRQYLAELSGNTVGIMRRFGVMSLEEIEAKRKKDREMREKLDAYLAYLSYTRQRVEFAIAAVKDSLQYYKELAKSSNPGIAMQARQAIDELTQFGNVDLRRARRALKPPGAGSLDQLDEVNDKIDTMLERHRILKKTMAAAAVVTYEVGRSAGKSIANGFRKLTAKLSNNNAPP